MYVSLWEKGGGGGGHLFQLISGLRVSCSPDESRRLHPTHAGNKRHPWNAALGLVTSIHLNNSVTKWLMTCWQDQVPRWLYYSGHRWNKGGDSCVPVKWRSAHIWARRDLIGERRESDWHSGHLCLIKESQLLRLWRNSSSRCSR